MSSEDAGIWNNYGVALDGLGRTNEALQAFRRAIECHPPSENAFIGLAFDFLRSGRLDEAAGALDQLDKLERGPNAVVLALRSVLARRSDSDGQADALERQARSLDAAAATWALGRATNTGNGTATTLTPPH
jgi:Flp pilus assembly protein TadD